MALQKQNIQINFSQGLDLKTDPNQLAPGRFLVLENTIFAKAGLLQKRNGYPQLAALPDTTSTFVTTFNGNLSAIGTKFYAYNAGTTSWTNKGSIQPLQLSVLPLIRSATNQTQCDSAVAANGLACVVYIDSVPSGGTPANQYKYAIIDSVTGQNIVAPTTITNANGSPKVFLLGNYFVIVFPSSVANHLQYIAVQTANPTAATGAVDLSTQYLSAGTQGAFDGAVYNGNLYVAFNGSDGGGAVRVTYLDSILAQHTTTVSATNAATLVSVAIDAAPSPNTDPYLVYVTFYNPTGTVTKSWVLNQVLTQKVAATLTNNVGTTLNLTSAAQNGSVQIFYEISSTYAYDATLASNFIKSQNFTQAGGAGAAPVMIRGVGLASKAFILNSKTYMLLVYGSTFQPTYFLTDSSGNVTLKLAYANGGGYLTLGLPSVTLGTNTFQVPYLIKDLISSVNKTQALASTAAAGVYSQTGINLATVNIATSNGFVTSEIGNNLHLSGGFLWMYDGYQPVEHNFHLWPDSVETTPATSAGGLSNQQYFYIATYEWADNQGNIFRSAPSIPVGGKTTGTTAVTFTSTFSSGANSIVVSSSANLFVGQVITDNTTAGNITTGTTITSISGTTLGLSLPTAGNSGSPDTLQTIQTNKITVNVPTLRLTNKTSNPVKIVLYRWSTAQQTYYQTTSILNPVLNDKTADSVSFTDTNNDLAIIGNNILYTSGGVVEDIAAPASSLMTLFKSRLFLVDAEDPNLLWFSKQVIDATPVEMSDLLTLFVAPTLSAQGNTGPITALSSMDDKLILFKKNIIYYMTGNGPDNTGANNDFSQPVFINSTVGCANQNSIVFIPNGLMFQSDKGIWLLGRDLTTNYIGAPVESYNSATVLSAQTIPGTNQVRFTLNNGITLMYDYFFNQWGTFKNIPSISSTLYQNLHTFINASGAVFQESPGTYLDGSSPVLMKFTTNWFNLAGLQGYERAYSMWLLATYLSPHKLSVGIAYDYNPGVTQVTMILPDNFAPAYGGDPTYGSAPVYGGPSNVEQWQVGFKKQKCEAFQVTISEVFDPSLGVTAGAGFTMSGLNLIVGAKRASFPLSQKRSVG